MDKGLIDVGLLLEPIDTSKYDFIRLSQKRPGAYSCGRSPFGRAGEDYTRRNCRVSVNSPSARAGSCEILNWLKREEKDLNIPLSYTLLSNAVLLVEEGLGCAFLPDGALAIRSSPHLRFIPIQPEHTTRSVLVWKKITCFLPRHPCLFRKSTCFGQN